MESKGEIISHFSNELLVLENQFKNGDLVAAFEKLDLLRKEMCKEIEFVYGKTGSTASLRGIMKMVDKADSLKRNILKSMARKL